MRPLKKSYLRALWVLRKTLFSFIDKFIPKKDNYWVFPVYFIGDGSFSDNMLAIYSKVKNDPSIKKIILTRDNQVSVEGINVIILPMCSYRASLYMLKSRFFFVQHSVWLDFASAKFQLSSPLNRHIINLWHGIPIKSLSHQNTGIYTKRGIKEMENYKIITSSEKDKQNMQAAFKYTAPNNFWITGIPRNDFMSCSKNELPKNYQADLNQLEEILQGRKLILYAPTYREISSGGTYYNFSNDELRKIENFCDEHNCVFGVRYHIYQRPKFINNLLINNCILDLSDTVIPDVRMLIRSSTILITDYSSIVVDALYLNVPFISFAYDLDDYNKNQRGFFYDYNEVFDDRIFREFDNLLKWLSMNILDEVITNKPVNSNEALLKQQLFTYSDNKNSERVVDNVKKLINA